jgi:hypothetical protein
MLVCFSNVQKVAIRVASRKGKEKEGDVEKGRKKHSKGERKNEKRVNTGEAKEN